MEKISKEEEEHFFEEYIGIFPENRVGVNFKDFVQLRLRLLRDFKEKK